MKITKIGAREIYDSRGWPTVACDVTLDDGTVVTASVPTGLSRGKYEAHEVRDGGKRLWGKGVLRAVEHINEIIGPGLIYKEPNGPTMDILMLDMDGTQDKSHLGANAILAVSMALYKAQAYKEEIELYELIAHIMGSDTVTMPFPQFNLFNGGMHGNNNMQIQEFLLVPAGASNFRAAMELCVTVFHELKNVLHKYGKSTAVGDEGGFAPLNVSDAEALQYLYEAIERISNNEGGNCVIGLDVAASHLYDPSTRLYDFKTQQMSDSELIEYYHTLMQEYPIYSLEDPLDQDDWDGWQDLVKELGTDVQIVGDDIFATNFHRIEEGIKKKIATAAIIKPDQIGTVTETLQAIQLCRQHELDIIVSHRSGETDETFIADLAVGTSAGQIKAGGCSRGERLAKYNRLLAIEDALLGETSEE